MEGFQAGQARKDVSLNKEIKREGSRLELTFSLRSFRIVPYQGREGERPLSSIHPLQVDRGSSQLSSRLRRTRFQRQARSALLLPALSPSLSLELIPLRPFFSFPGNESFAVVEYATYQKVPVERKKVDPKQGTIDDGESKLDSSSTTFPFLLPRLGHFLRLLRQTSLLSSTRS